MRLFGGKRRPGKDNLLQRYLLGGCTEETASELERRLLSDDAAFADMLAAEEELIDAYLDQNLAVEDRRSFERTFLSAPRRREKVEIARRLGRGAAETRAPRRAASGWVTAGALTAALFLIGVTWFQHRRIQELERQQLAALSSRRPRADGEEYSFLLRYSAHRAHDRGQWLIVPAVAASVKFLLEMPVGIPAGPFDARLETVEGVQVWGGKGQANGTEGALQIPRAALQSGDHVLVVERDRRTIATYILRVLTH